MKTKDKVLEVEEVMLKEGISKEKIKRINLKEAFEGCITLVEVGKVIDEMDVEDFKHIKFKRPYFRGKEELKQKLGI